MELIYRRSESTVKPVSIEKSKHTVFIRKNIVETERIDDYGTSTIYWVYEEAKMSHEDFAEYSQLSMAENAINANDDKENNTNNQFILMEAIADLYDLVASLS